MIMVKKSFLFQALAVAALVATGCGSGSGGSAVSSATTGACTPATGAVKIGFIVKSMADSWFQNETNFAKSEGDSLGAEVNVQEAKDDTAVITTIDTMATNGVQGIIICSPETQLGPAIKSACDKHNIKLMSVDDRLVDSSGKPMTEVPHLGISATKIGNQVGQAISDEMKKRGWKPDEVGALAITVPTLQTAVERVTGAESVLKSNGFKPENFFEAPWSGAVDVASASDASNAVITAHSGVKKWVVFSSNDDGVLGGVRSLSNRGIAPADIIGVGINGPLAAAEWMKGQPTGIVASVMLQSKVHGANTVEMMDKWIKACTKPPMETYTTGELINKDNYKAEMTKAGVPLPTGA